MKAAPTESFVRLRIAPRDIIGVVVSSKIQYLPLQKEIDHILASSNPKRLYLEKQGFKGIGIDEHDDGHLRQRFLQTPMKNPEAEAMRIQFQESEAQLFKCLDELSAIFGVGSKPTKKYIPQHYGQLPGIATPRVYDSHSVERSDINRLDLQSYINVETVDKKTGHHTYKLETDRTLARYLDPNYALLGVDKARNLTDYENELIKLKKTIETHKANGSEMSLQEFAAFVRSQIIPQFRIDIPGSERQQETPQKKGIFGSLQKLFASKVPTWRLITAMEIADILEKTLQARKTRTQIYYAIWPKYLESVADKPLDQATIGDFLAGLCKEHAIPLYDRSGNVLWPPPEE